jgi:WhiB family redox-sensing transcriptional regulator
MPSRRVTTTTARVVVAPRFILAAAEPDAEPACRGEDPELFFPPRGGSTRPAKVICSRCPLVAPCRAWAMQQSSYLWGIWGGTSWEDRNRRTSGRASR